MPAAVQLFEKLLADAQVNKEAYTNMTSDILKARSDAKLNQGQNFSRLMSFAMYGPKSPATNLLTEAELTNMKPQVLHSYLTGKIGEHYDTVISTFVG